jgi:hypothetical protein
MKRAGPIYSWRRGLSLAILVALAAIVPGAASADNGDPIYQGDSRGCTGFGSGYNCASNLTVIDTTGQGFVFLDGSAGAGWQAPSGTLIGWSGSAGPAIHGVNKQNGNAVWGESNSAAAVFGQSNSNFGVTGRSSSGTGVYGYSVGGTGASGQSDATDGAGVKGYAVNGGYAKGVWGVSSGGYGGFFEAPGSVGYGVYASGGEFGVRAVSPTGIGVQAESNAAEGTGLKAMATNGDFAYGVWGVSKTGYGGYFDAPGASGHGVYARGGKVGVQAVSSTGIGVQGDSTASDGTAIKATATNGGYAKGVWGVSNNGYAGFFEAPGSVGYGIYAKGGHFGVNAVGGPTGVYGTGSVSGVEGESASGAGVNGHTASGIGVKASANGGIALQVQGRAKFSRSGTVVVGANTSSKTVSLSGTTGNSMILAIAQQNANVFVKATVPAAGSFTIYLTGNAPASGLKVAYFVLN